MSVTDNTEERLKQVEAAIAELEECLDIPEMQGDLRKLQIVVLESSKILSNMLRDIDKRVTRIEKNLVKMKT